MTSGAAGGSKCAIPGEGLRSEFAVFLQNDSAGSGTARKPGAALSSEGLSTPVPRRHVLEAAIGAEVAMEESGGLVGGNGFTLG
jgi:hypothetical protein